MALNQNVKDEKVQKFIEMASQQPLTKQPWGDMALQLGVNRKTIYAWRDKYATEIAEYTLNESQELIPELLAVGKNLLMSNRTQDKKVGVDVLLKLDHHYQVLQDKEQINADALRYKYIMKGILEALQINDNDTLKECINLVSSLVIKMMIEEPERYREDLKDSIRMSTADMLDSLRIQ